eukprot:tig00000383_g24693.t1
MAENVRVAVRIRPLSEKENAASSKICLETKSGSASVEVVHPSDKKKVNKFAFSNVWQSYLKDREDHTTNLGIFDSLKSFFLESAWQGYNTSIFAYGQTGSGKTHTMLGTEADPGIIPRTVFSIMERVRSQRDAAGVQAIYEVQVSFLEVYKEKVSDLLNPKGENLKLREHPVTGVYVEGLTKTPVSSAEGIAKLMARGTASRTTASTNMNAQSSRSHAVFALELAQAEKDPQTGRVLSKSARVSLVDLAGSERADSTGATGERLREGAAINQSLSALGNVIAALTEGKGRTHIPYRDSALTMLLRESLGGNAKTIMLATVSPAEAQYEETLSTLRYAERAKAIVNRATVNENPTDKLIRELREEIELLKAMLHERDQALLKAKIRVAFRHKSRVYPEQRSIETETEPAAEDVDLDALPTLPDAEDAAAAADGPPGSARGGPGSQRGRLQRGTAAEEQMAEEAMLRRGCCGRSKACAIM